MEYATRLEVGLEGPAKMPEGWRAQEGYMTTEGESFKSGGYIIAVDDMPALAEKGFTGKGWKLFG